MYEQVECKRIRHRFEVYQFIKIGGAKGSTCTEQNETSFLARFRFLRPENKGFVWVDEWQDIGIPANMDML